MRILFVVVQSLSPVLLFVIPWTVVRIFCPWGFLGKDTEMGCFSRGSSWSRDWAHVCCIGRLIPYCWVTREVPYVDKVIGNFRNYNSISSSILSYFVIPLYNCMAFKFLVKLNKLIKFRETALTNLTLFQKDKIVHTHAHKFNVSFL